MAWSHSYEKLDRPGGDVELFILTGPGLLHEMAAQMADDFEQDLCHLRRMTGASIEVQQACNRLCLRGSPSSVSCAKAELEKVLCFYFPLSCASIRLPSPFVNYLVSKSHHELKGLESLAAVVDVDEDAGAIWISGDASSVESVRVHLQKLQQRWERCNVQLIAEYEWQCRSLAKDGSELRNLEHDTGALIEVDCPSRTITITGQEDAVQQAKLKILVSRWTWRWIIRTGGARQDGGAYISDSSNKCKKNCDFCTDFISRGRCSRGPNCPWKHGDLPNSPQGLRYQDDACWDFQHTGRCKRGDRCSWRHIGEKQHRLQ
eukprot:TRINITY_DN98258_c0_g1_i1.p1 TRINITY_DN98258_c0_g1~~TRINITY_DN98258_c0_g1_i1.p1  ORF type:complete len:318 (+),score=36.46 TRINITY_DN98258_c0_g1_i1:57-1010(+)